ncbi:hypothetical protein P152DRAFT_481261 [Eremomyces bilateralis CBS 781.70]|uniref:Uncharacterized protein n=1 Tax=Eremomyces bilateralis CBS 781.70 TaxID=1392243 RepID=A0A6G1G4X0_9PEZI|nr:uncharacterized protein P152DRAFT_481261 [Eremomyces bilateralis CBS 781.70]KAF1813117.1 hypothetical protein P152DRAFT_481261 [Eremomyces bilateralis CBS 781.70]
MGALRQNGADESLNVTQQSILPSHHTLVTVNSHTQSVSASHVRNSDAHDNHSDPRDNSSPQFADDEAPDSTISQVAAPRSHRKKETKKPRPHTRQIIRWDKDLIERTLIGLVHESNKANIQLPWEAVGQWVPKNKRNMSSPSGEAIRQQIEKRRKRRRDDGEPVPPLSPRVDTPSFKIRRKSSSQPANRDQRCKTRISDLANSSADSPTTTSSTPTTTFDTHTNSIDNKPGDRNSENAGSSPAYNPFPTDTGATPTIKEYKPFTDEYIPLVSDRSRRAAAIDSASRTSQITDQENEAEQLASLDNNSASFADYVLANNIRESHAIHQGAQTGHADKQATQYPGNFGYIVQDTMPSVMATSGPSSNPYTPPGMLGSDSFGSDSFGDLFGDLFRSPCSATVEPLDHSNGGFGGMESNTWNDFGPFADLQDLTNGVQDEIYGPLDLPFGGYDGGYDLYEDIGLEREFLAIANRCNPTQNGAPRFSISHPSGEGYNHIGTQFNELVEDKIPPDNWMIRRLLDFLRTSRFLSAFQWMNQLPLDF